MSKPNSIALESVTETDNSDIIIAQNDNQRSVTNMVTERVREHILKTIHDYPQYFAGLGERDLRNLLKPNDTVCRIRIAFWQEYFRAQDIGKSMQMSRVYAGVTDQDTFYGPILSKPQNVAWIITPPVKYMLAMDEALNRGLSNLTKIMEIDITDENGKVLPKNATIFLKAFELINERVNGAVIQKIEQKNLTLTAKVGQGKPADMDALSAELKELREKSKLLPEIEAKPVVQEDPQ